MVELVDPSPTPRLYQPPNPAEWISPGGAFFSMKGRPGDLVSFLAPSPPPRHRELRETRRSAIETFPACHACWNCISASQWQKVVEAGKRAGIAPGLAESAEDFSTTQEPDWIWVDRSGSEPVARASSVCYPSGWAPEDITGQSILSVHGVVPGLNAKLGEAIHRFLQRLKVDQAWERFNWGLAPTDQLNRHPASRPPSLNAEQISTGHFYLRTEHHLFWAITPETVLFLIRIECHAWSALEALLRAALRAQLEDMTPELRAYKGIPSIPGN